MTSSPLCTANLVVNETSSSVTVPPTKQGPCSENARPRPTPEAISKTSWLWSAGAPKNRSETPKKDLGKRWPRTASATVARTKLRGVQHSHGSTEPTSGGWVCQPGLSVAPHRAKFSFSTGVGLWLGDHLPGDQCPTVGPEGRLRPTVYCQCSKAVSYTHLTLPTISSV